MIDRLWFVSKFVQRKGYVFESGKNFIPICSNVEVDGHFSPPTLSLSENITKKVEKINKSLKKIVTYSARKMGQTTKFLFNSSFSFILIFFLKNLQFSCFWP